MGKAAPRPQAKILRDGSERLLDAAGISVDRMPMLHVIFDRMVGQCAESLRQLAASPALFAVTSTRTERIGDILESYEGHSLVAIYHVQPWDARILIGLDNKFVFGLVEALFGGDGSEPPYAEMRGISNIERRIAQKIFDQAARALQNSFAAVHEMTMKFERVETRMDFAVIAPRPNFAVISRFGLRVLDRGGEMFVAIPQTAIKPLKQSLAHDITNDIAIRDPRWTRQISNEVGRTEVTVRAVIEEYHFTLDDIAGLQVGQVMKLKATTESRVKLESNAQPLFWCELGQADGLYTLRVDEHIDAEQEFLDDLVDL